MNRFLRDLALTWLGIDPKRLSGMDGRIDALTLKVEYLESRLQEYIDCGAHSLHGR